MKMLNFKMILSVLFTLLVSITMANSVADFSLNTNSISDSVELGSSSNAIFTIENTGNETLDLVISTVDLTLDDDNSFAISLNSSLSIDDLAEGESISILASYAPSGIDTGDYVGNIIVTNVNNSSQSENVVLNVEVTTASNPLITIDGVTNGIIEADGDIGEKETFNIRLRNNGNLDLTDIKFDFSDLEGDDFGDNIDERDVDVDDDGFDLDVGDSENVRIEIDVPNDINLDVYYGEMTIKNDEGHEFTFEIRFETTGGDLDINIRDNELDVEDGVLYVVGEAGEEIDNIEFKLSNDGNIDVRDVVFRIDGDFEEEFSSNELSADIVEFSPDSTDIDSDDQEIIELIINIPDDAESGTYLSEIDVSTSSGDFQDSIRVELKVVGEVYIDKIEVPETVNPGDNMDVKVTVGNVGSTLQRNVKITATLFDADIGNSDIVESSSTFLLDVNDEKTETLRFKIPEEASDGSHTLEVRVDYGDEEIVELEDVIIERPLHNLIFDSYGINPSTIRCQDTMYTFMDVENLGKYDESVVFSVEILGTTISQRSSSLDLETDESFQRNFNLDVSSLESGTYTIEHIVSYNGDREVRASTLTVLDCDESNSGGLIIDTDNNTNLGNETTSQEDTITLFNQELEKTTVYLGGGVGVVFILIIISLFFL